VAALFLKMIDAVMGWKYRSASATNSDARVKLGVPTSSQTSLPARIEIAVRLVREAPIFIHTSSSQRSPGPLRAPIPYLDETFTVVVGESSDT
jgi:hypothetical protein